jgi:glycosyltransferase involved in cell wall biosynthesis
MRSLSPSPPAAPAVAPTVEVLLSTYNGAPFLRPQLDSILEQTHPATRLFVRDDGSHDATRAILDAYADRHDAVRVAFGANVGVIDSFLTLLAQADPEADYYAFSDQDDVWRADKLARAVARLEAAQAPGGDDVPRLYFARQELVDEALRPLGLSPVPRHLGFRNALVQNQAIGCTTVINRAARALVVAHPPQQALMHDWWIYAVVAAFGEVLYDPAPTMRYRQHGANVVGDTPDALGRFLRRLRRFLTRNWRNDIFRPSDQARELLRVFGDRLPPGPRAHAEAMVASKDAGWLRRLAYACTTAAQRNTRADDLLLRFMIAINRY